MIDRRLWKWRWILLKNMRWPRASSSKTEVCVSFSNFLIVLIVSVDSVEGPGTLVSFSAGLNGYQALRTIQNELHHYYSGVSLYNSYRNARYSPSFSTSYLSCLPSHLSCRLHLSSWSRPFFSRVFTSKALSDDGSLTSDRFGPVFQCHFHSYQIIPFLIILSFLLSSSFSPPDWLHYMPTNIFVVSSATLSFPCSISELLIYVGQEQFALLICIHIE